MADETDVVVGEGGAALEPVTSGAETAGMPQLDFSTFPNQIFWLIVALIAIYLILSRVALPRIGGVLAERSGAITNDVAAAEDLKAQAADAEAAYEQALKDARSEANRISQETRDEIQEELDRAIAEADAEIAARTAESEKQIDAIRAQSADSVRQVARETAEAIVEAMGVNADGGRIDAAVDARTGGN